MKPKPTKAQKARAKRAVLGDFAAFLAHPNRGCGMNEREMLRPYSPEWPEVERLLGVAIKAVRHDGNELTFKKALLNMKAKGVRW